MWKELLSPSTDSQSSIRLQMLFTCFISNLIILPIWAYLCITSKNVLDFPTGVTTIYLAVNGISVVGKIAQKIVEMALRQAFEKYQIQMTTTDGLNHENETIQPGPLTVKPTVHALGKWSEQKEAYYETRTVYKKITVEDNKGRDTTITVPTNETIYHPARIAWHAVANLEFVVTSPDDKKVYMIYYRIS